MVKDKEAEKWWQRVVAATTKGRYAALAVYCLRCQSGFSRKIGLVGLFCNCVTDNQITEDEAFAAHGLVSIQTRYMIHSQPREGEEILA